MRIRYSGMWNKTPAQEQIARSRNIVPRFIPEIRQLQQRHVQQKNANEDKCKDQAWVRTRMSHSELFYIPSRDPTAQATAQIGPLMHRP